MKKATQQVISAYQFNSAADKATVTAHAVELVADTATFKAAGVTYMEAIGTRARALLESGIFGEDEGKARKAIAVLVSAIIKAEFPDIGSSTISDALIASGFRTRAARTTTTTTKATPAEAIVQYLKGHTAADIKKALKVMGYSMTKTA
jgi:hypothetical protein